MSSEFLGGVVFSLWAAAALVAAFIGGWWAHKSMWSEHYEQINAFWQEDRNRVDELLQLCESHQKALQAAHDLRPEHLKRSSS